MDVRELWSGRESPARVYGFVERLIDEPWSRWRARQLGGDHFWREHLGWGPAEYLAALQVDAVQSGTAVAAVAGSGKRPRRVKPMHRPTHVQALSADERDALELERLTPGADFLSDDEDEEV